MSNRRNRVLTALLCAGITITISQGVEAYSRYRRQSSAWNYSRLNPSRQSYSVPQGRGYDVWSDYRFTRGRAGELTESNVHEYRYRFRGGQSRQAAVSALGTPYHQDGNRQVWRLKQGGTFEVRYQGDRGYGYANFK